MNSKIFFINYMNPICLETFFQHQKQFHDYRTIFFNLLKKSCFRKKQANGEGGREGRGERERDRDRE